MATKYSWAWIKTDWKDGQKVTVAESNDWFDTEQEARADANLSKVCDLDMPDSWGLDLVIKKVGYSPFMGLDLVIEKETFY